MRFPFSASWLSVIALALAFSLANGAAAAPEHHTLVRFWIDSAADQEFIDRNAGRLDIATGRKGEYYDVIVPQSRLAEFLTQGYRTEVQHQDLETFYAERLGRQDNFGAYHAHSEVIAWMDELHTLYPEVISAKWSIGQSIEGNDIWCFRVSDNPEMDEPGEPEVLFDALHHSREVMSSEMVMMLSEHLGAQYQAGAQDIVTLLDANEVYMVPMVNPDGFLYNELTNPSGGGLWRKNRRDNGDGTRGVDLNRNYPYEWGCDEGSSGYTDDPTYRGPVPGSEPETQAMMAFINAHDFVISQSFHTHGNLTLYPWGYTVANTPDEAIFRETAAAMVQFNGYAPGQPDDPGMLYPVCGGSFDWDYGQEDEHAKIFAFSNEIGNSSDGFWPADSRRQTLFEDNLWPALYLIQIAGSLRGVSFTHTPLPYATPQAGQYELTAVPVGFAGESIDPATVVVRYRVDAGAFSEIALNATENPGEYQAVIPGQDEGATVEYYLSAADVQGRVGNSPREAPAVLYSFEVGTAFSHVMEAGRGWTSGAADDDASSGLWVRVDPVGTTAQPEDDHSDTGSLCWVTGQHVAGETTGYNDVDGGRTTLYSPVYDLSGADQVTFSYWRWYSNSEGNNPNSDFWDVHLSNDGGQTWVALEHTTTSSNAWENRTYDLADYHGVAGQVQLKFVASDEDLGTLVEAAVDDFLIAGVFNTTDVAEAPLALRVSLAQNYPNPFNPTTSIRFRLPREEAVQLGVFDVRGRLVRSLVNGSLPAGDHLVNWNGRDALGRHAASGVYFYRLRTAGGEDLSCRMMMMK